MTERPTNILFFIIDSLRRDRLSCYGYEKETSPFIDSIAESGVKFEQAVAPAPWTVPVHGSLFSGELPATHGSHRQSKSFKIPAEESLAGRLSKNGYRTAGFSANPWLTPEFDFDRGFDHFSYLKSEPPFPEEEVTPDREIADLLSKEDIKQILTWMGGGNLLKRFSNGIWGKFTKNSFANVANLGDSMVDWVGSTAEENKFIFANFMQVHDPHSDQIIQGFPLGKNIVSFQSEPENPKRGRNLYDESIRNVDDGLSTLFDRLSSHIDLENTLTIIMGDHGECMGEHGYWGHGTYLYDEIIQVPLIVDFPESTDTSLVPYDKPFSLVELFEFILGAAEDSSTSETSYEGFLNADEPLFAESTGPRPNMEGIASKFGYQAVIDDGWKMVRNRETDELILETFGRFEDDHSPSEPVLDHLEELGKSKWSQETYTWEDDEQEISSETERHLSELGYL